MKINTYRVMKNESNVSMLVKERTVNYGEVSQITETKDVAKIMTDVFSLHKLAEEHIYVITINQDNRIGGIFEVSHGTVAGTMTSAREVFVRAILVGATRIIMVHNHPAGSLRASSEDISITKTIKGAGEILGIPLLDHVIIGENGGFDSIISLA